jgi:AcrR family transcriptional regulator
MRSSAPPTDGRHRRSDETRRRLLGVAVRMFATHGFDAASTREVAESAGVNQAAILYHFGGKEGLYLAVAEAIAARGRDAMRPYLSAAGAIPSTPAAARTALAALLRGLVRGLLAVAGDGSAAAFIVREQAAPGPAFDCLYREYLSPLHSRVTALVAAATGRHARDTAAVLDAHAIIGMALGFAVARETALRRAGWSTYTEAHLDQIADAVVTLADRALTPPRPRARSARGGSRG